MDKKKATPAQAPLPRLSVYLVVFICGGIVMILELGGARQLAPSFGQGLYVWSALITITLLGLAARGLVESN